jgi:antitoxin VapB
MTATAKIFMHGRSQAVRLPKEFRMPGTEVLVSRQGDKVILEPVKRVPGNPDEYAAMWAKIDALRSDDFFADGRQQPPLPDDRDFGFDR